MNKSKHMFEELKQTLKHKCVGGLEALFAAFGAMFSDALILSPIWKQASGEDP